MKKQNSHFFNGYCLLAIFKNSWKDKELKYRFRRAKKHIRKKVTFIHFCAFTLHFVCVWTQKFFKLNINFCNICSETLEPVFLLLYNILYDWVANFQNREVYPETFLCRYSLQFHCIEPSLHLRDVKGIIGTSTSVKL